MVMFRDGRVFEALPGAYDDCKNRLLRINSHSDTMYIEALPDRVEKLVARGWKSEIDVKTEMEKFKKKESRRARRHSKRASIGGPKRTPLGPQAFPVGGYLATSPTARRVQKETASIRQKYKAPKRGRPLGRKLKIPKMKGLGSTQASYHPSEMAGVENIEDSRRVSTGRFSTDEGILVEEMKRTYFGKNYLDRGLAEHVSRKKKGFSNS
jgi:hypothetical protein